MERTGDGRERQRDRGNEGEENSVVDLRCSNHLVPFILMKNGNCSYFTELLYYASGAAAGTNLEKQFVTVYNC